jgi:rhodanese-related sulfurtransferase
MKELFVPFGMVCLASTAGAVPATLAHSACPHSAVDLNVPYYELVQTMSWNEQTGGWTMAFNPRFVVQLDERPQQRGVSQDTVVMLICRSGDGTALAADELTLRGYRRVVSVVVDGDEADVGPDGQRALNGWKNAGLPWTARADAALIARVR